MNAIPTNFDVTPVQPSNPRRRKLKVHQPEVNAPAVFLKGPDVLRRYRISHVTLWRWIRDAKDGFPKPTKFGRFNFWLLSDLEAWEAAHKVVG